MTFRLSSSRSTISTTRVVWYSYNKGADMPDKTIDQIQSRIAGSPNLTDENRAAMLELVGELREEINDLSTTRHENAREIAQQAEIVTRPVEDPDVVQQSIERLSASVDKLEGSHPRLTQAVNGICNLLSRMGI
jgi:chorismate mutase